MQFLFVEQLLNGIQLGVILFLMAAGLTLTFGIMNLVNLAHGSLFMLGAYLGVVFALVTGSFVAGFAAAGLVTFVIGLVLERLVIRHLYARSHLDQVMCTVGLVYVLNEATRMVFGPEPLHAPIPAFLAGSVELIPGAPYPVYRLAMILAGLAIGGLLYVLIGRTRMGMLIRAGASNRVMTSVLGVNIGAIYAVVFGIGAALAGVAGYIAAPILTVYPGMGDNVLILALVVLVVGGLGSVKGAFVAALLVGISDTVGRAYLKDLMALVLSPVAANTVAPALASMLIYILMAVILVFRPQGLIPAAGLRRPEAPSESSDHGPSGPGVLARWRVPAIGILGGAFLLLPLVAGLADQPFWVDMGLRVIIFAIAALSLDLILGQTGLVSFGHALYLGIGAYVVGILADAGIESGFVQWPLAMLISALLAAALSVVALRTSGTFFIMITLAFAQMVFYGASSLYDYGGDDGMHLAVRSTFGGLVDLYDSRQFYYLALALLVVLAGLNIRLARARFGMVLKGIRINERRMEAAGFPTFRYKLAACVISAAVCGLAGAMLANAAEFVGPQYMDWTRSAELMIMVVAGGLATPIGAIIGALAYLGIEKYLSDLTIHWRLGFGALLILLVFLGRGGLSALFAPGAAGQAVPAHKGSFRWAIPFFRPRA